VVARDLRGRRGDPAVGGGAHSERPSAQEGPEKIIKINKSILKKFILNTNPIKPLKHQNK